MNPIEDAVTVFLILALMATVTVLASMALSTSGGL